MREPNPDLMRALTCALPESGPAQPEEIADAARSVADWFADMLDDYAKDQDDENIRVGLHRAATQVRRTGGVR